MTAFSEVWNGTFEGEPADSEGAKLGAGRIRDTKRDVRERMVVDHSWAGNSSDGQHIQVSLIPAAAKPTLDATVGGLYTKVVNGRTELFYEDSTGVENQLTSAGALSSWTTGDAKLSLKTVADAGWVMANDGTIGDATSGGTTRANADTVSLFTLLWNNTVNADCPVLPGGRGVSAAADYAAHSTITLPLALGRALAVSGAGAGLTARALAHTVGEETHLLATGELPAHSHGVTDPGHTHTHDAANASGSYAGGGGANPSNGSPNTSSNVTGISINNAGGGAAHNNMQPTTFLNVMIKL